MGPAPSCGASPHLDNDAGTAIGRYGTLFAMLDPEGKLIATHEVLERAEISRQVLYRYMQLELVVPAHTTETGRNYFSPRVFQILRFIGLLKGRGYTLRDIKDMFGLRMARAQRAATTDDPDPSA